MKFSLTLMAGLAAAASFANAAPVAYNITFTATAGTAPTAGSFLYDSATQTFSSFNVVWDGVTLDFTPGANSPRVFGACNTPDANSADYFAYLNGNGCMSSPWDMQPGGSAVLGTLGANSRGLSTAFARANAPYGGLEGIAQGTFTVAAAAASEVPEPSSWALFLAGGALLARRRGSRGDSRT